MRGARIIDRWRNPETETLYALARIDLDGVRSTMDELEAMDPSLRRHMQNNAEKVFEEMRLEEEKGR